MGLLFYCAHIKKALKNAIFFAQAGIPLGDHAPAVPMARVVGWELEITVPHGIAASEKFPEYMYYCQSGCRRRVGVTLTKPTESASSDSDRESESDSSDFDPGGLRTAKSLW